MQTVIPRDRNDLCFQNCNSFINLSCKKIVRSQYAGETGQMCDLFFYQHSSSDEHCEDDLAIFHYSAHKSFFRGGECMSLASKRLQVEECWYNELAFHLSLWNTADLMTIFGEQATSPWRQKSLMRAQCNEKPKRTHNNKEGCRYNYWIICTWVSTLTQTLVFVILGGSKG